MILQNQDISKNFSDTYQYSPVLEEKFRGTLEVEMKPLYGYINIYGAEIAELRERVERLEQKQEQQIVPIQFLESEKLELKQPIVVSLCYYPKDENYVVDCVELNIYGEGRDEYEALKDFKVALEESYFSLKKDQDKLVQHLQEEWKNLQAVIKEK